MNFQLPGGETRGPRGFKLFGIAALAVLAMAVVVAGCGGGGSDSTSSSSSSSSGESSDEKYSIYLTNNFSDNDWRQQMQKTAEIIATKPPYADKVELTVANSDESPQAQTTVMNNIIAQKPDAIIMEAASPTAVNPAIERACAAGIVVVNFDALATAPCAWKINTKVENDGAVVSAFIAQMLGGKGSVAIDFGLAGNPVGLTWAEASKEAYAKYPEIEIAAEIEGGYNPGQEQQEVSRVLASEPNLGGVSTIYVGSPVITAFQQAGKDEVAFSGSANNQGMLECMKDPGAKCIFTAKSPGISALAMATALEILTGERSDQPETIWMNGEDGVFYAKGATKVDDYPNAEIVPIEPGKTVYPDDSPALGLPLLPVELTDVTITPEELK